MSQKASFRADIEGLRAVAILLVLAYHADAAITGGYVGVDVFFVISGFLITSLLVREVESRGTISLVDFYARRARRLLPAASLVLVFSAVTSWFLGPVTQRGDFSLDVAAAAGYVVNWRLAARAIDYLAEDVGLSPVLHFWSLSVEEQFYFVWPLLILLATLAARKTGWSRRRLTVAFLLLVAVPSLGWSIYYTNESPSEAFFATTTRLWELGLGALLAVFKEPLRRAPPLLLTVAAWLGLGAILLSALLFSDDSLWPSYLALLPTVGTALMIAAGLGEAPPLPSRFLSLRPFVWVGGLSYSVYLWHWPLLVIGQAWCGLEGSLWGVGIVVASFVPAWLSYRFVERPVRFFQNFHMPALRTVLFGLGISSTLVALGFALSAGAVSDEPDAASTLQDGIKLRVRGTRVYAVPDDLGAGALGETPRQSPWRVPRQHYDTMIPGLAGAPKDLPDADSRGCHADIRAEVPSWCVVGAPEGSKRIVVVGDSKANQYLDAWDAAGRALDLRIEAATKRSCAFTPATTLRHKKPYRACTKHNEVLFRQLLESPPYAVVTSQDAASGSLSEDGRAPSERHMTTGLIRYWRALKKKGVKIVVLLDTPHPPRNLMPLYECMTKHGSDATACAFSREGGVARSSQPVVRAAAARVKGVHIIDLTDFICPGTSCPPVIGDVFVYRQGSHLTNSYVHSLTPRLTEELEAALE